MITILPQTDKEPLNTIGYCAGVCWNSPVEDKEKNIKRAKSCIKSGHTRTAEYPDVFCVIEGYSARAIRELYTHIVGTTRLQSSTRYVDAKTMDVNEEFYYPFEDEAKDVYKEGLTNIMQTYQKLEELGAPKEDAANILPLGMDTKIVWKINLRALMHFMNLRLCSRAYKEIRALSMELKEKLRVLSPEWEWICDELFVPKCEAIGYCDEEHTCGRKITKKEMLEAIEAWKKNK
ncbi:FAD-dependent thymidylate synthase [Treponema sp.]|uniref:FAD-dependent thymidylate synthase n=1 Tax=Treponema sp. TaxID=166 RepID=UPI00298D681D|nr:FAD-dependent thymidylate synthase [Treponema sp.]